MLMRLMKRAEADSVAQWVAALQADPQHQIAYFGTTAPDIQETLLNLEGLLDVPVVVATQDKQIFGLLGVDYSPGLGRAWLYGPLVSAGNWDATADALLAYARQHLIPAETRSLEWFVDVRHSRMTALAARYHFDQLPPETSWSFPRQRLSTLPPGKLPALDVAHQSAFIALHDSLFPNTYYSGAEIIARLDAANRVLMALEGSQLVGYIYGRVDAGADHGYIDFVGVDPAQRRRGVGRALVSAMTHSLLQDESLNSVKLTVSATNSGAMALYHQLGFERLQTLVAYRRTLPSPP